MVLDQPDQMEILDLLEIQAPRVTEVTWDQKGLQDDRVMKEVPVFREQLDHKDEKALLDQQVHLVLEDLRATRVTKATQAHVERQETKACPVLMVLMDVTEGKA